MATTLNLRDHLGRLLQNETPGTTDPALDFMGREIEDDDTDFVGRDLISTAWDSETAYSAGDYVDLSGGELLVAVGAGTSDTEGPTAPAYGATVEDATVTWRRVH